MTYQSQQNELQNSYYTQMANDLLKVHPISNNKLVFRHVNTEYSDHPTQFLNELGTTDMAIGDATAEIMITTIGRIPNEMYYLEDTTPSGKITVYDTEAALDNYNHTTSALLDIVKSDEYTACSTLLLALLTILLIILLLCCVTACIIASSRRKHIFFNRSDIECSPTCSGVKQPLLRPDKISDTTRTSDNSTNN